MNLDLGSSFSLNNLPPKLGADSRRSSLFDKTDLVGSGADSGSRTSENLRSSNSKETQNVNSKKAPEKSSSTDFDRTLDRVSTEGPDEIRARSQGPSESSPSSRDGEARVTDKTDQADNSGKNRNVTRQAAMEVFLNRMHDELGINPEDILNAFAQLSESELNASPEASADALIAKLNLDSGKSGKALDLYNQMLAMTAMAGMSQYLQQNGQHANLEVMDKREVELQALRTSIDDMNDRFFMSGTHAHLRPGVDQQGKIINAYKSQQGMNEQLGRAGMNNQTSQNLDGEIAAGSSAGLASGNAEASSLTTDSGSMGSNSVLSSPSGADITGFDLESGTDSVDQSMLENSKKLNTQSESKDISQFGEGKFDLSDTAQDFDTNYIEGSNKAGLNSNAAKYEVPTTQNSMGNMSTTSAPIEGSSFGAGASGYGDGSSEEGGSSSFEQSNYGNLQQGHVQSTQGKGPQSFIVNPPQATTADLQANVKEIISHAQFLAQKGGGEMKIALNPQGLGELNLKVKMTNGNVNVEMVTESNEAKKILEKGLSELKDNLALHKLHLDSIKIENNKDVSNQLDQRQNDLERGFEQKFLGDFSERNSNMRREFFEPPAPHLPTSQTRDPASNSKYDPKGKKSGSSRRLDLVA